MADRYKITCIFKVGGQGGFPDAGFSESWYIDAGSISAAMTVATNYGMARVLLSHAFVTFTHARVTSTTMRGISMVQREPANSGIGTSVDTPWQAVWLDCQTAEGLRRQFMLRGMRDDFILNEGWSPDSVWNTNFTNWKSIVTGTPLLLLGRNRANALQTVLGVDGAGVVTTALPHGLADTNVWKFYRTKDSNGRTVSGKYFVTVNTATTFTVAGWQVGRVVNSGFGFKYALQAAGITTATVAGVRKRSVGRPFVQLRGRSIRRSA